MQQSWSASLDTPVGSLRIEATEKGICAVCFATNGTEEVERGAPPPCLLACIKQMEEYFSGARTVFTDLPLVVRGTEFQSRVWDQTLGIGYGSTATYGELAGQIGQAGAARAVGNALNRNPLCIIVPCHRVVGASEDAGGYAGGVERKHWLLQHERAISSS